MIVTVTLNIAGMESICSVTSSERADGMPGVLVCTQHYHGSEFTPGLETPADAFFVIGQVLERLIEEG